MIFAIELGVAMILSIPITYIIIHLHKAKDRKLIFGDKLEDNQDDNPLLLTVKAMEAELAELKENNIHMERIAQLEKDIEEANKQAEALSKVVNDYGSTMEEVGESISEVKGSEFVVGGIKGKGLIVNKVSSYEGEIGRIIREHQEENRKIIEQLDSNIKNTIQEAFEDSTKPDWDGYTNSLLNKDHNLISHTKGSIYQGDHKNIQGLLDYIEEELRLTGDTCLRFGSRTRFFSIMILLHNLSLDEFKSKVSYWDKSYDLLLANKESYGVKRKLFEQEVFNFEEFRQAVVSYFKENEEEELLNLIVKASEEFHRTAYGQWNIIPRDGLSHEERAEKFINRWVKNENN